MKTHAASHRLALKSKWMAWSSRSLLLARYELMVLPIAVDRSKLNHRQQVLLNEGRLWLTWEPRRFSSDALLLQVFHEQLDLTGLSRSVQTSA